MCVRPLPRSVSHLHSTPIIEPDGCVSPLPCRTLFSSDQSFPLAGAFAYSVYRFQSKRIKNNPEGPFFGGNAIVGALITTTINIGIACAVGEVDAAGAAAAAAAAAGNEHSFVHAACACAMEHKRLTPLPAPRPTQVMTVLSAPLASLLDSSLRQVGGCFVILIAGALGLFLK